MGKHDTAVGLAVIFGAFGIACALVVACWFLDVYLIVKTAKWMGWL